MIPRKKKLFLFQAAVFQKVDSSIQPRVLRALFPRGGGGGYSIYIWVGRCGAAPHTLTLFKTNIADFPTLFKTEFRFLIPYLRHLSCLRQKLIDRYPD